MKVFKKNQLAILVIALMLITAGYLNYGTVYNKELAKDTGTSLDNTIDLAELGDAELVNTNVIEDYPYITNNCIDLNNFIEEYKQNQTSSMKEEGDTIILKTISNSENPYIKYETLTLDKKTCKPLQMEIKSDNQKTTIYILYNEVKIKE